MIERTGDIVAAKKIARMDDPIYRLRGEITTGPYAGTECYVAHRSPEFDKETFLVRLDNPRRTITNIPSSDSTQRAYFLTTNIPEGFYFERSDETLLCGRWMQIMKELFNVRDSPHIGHILGFYDPGFVKRELHFHWKNNKVHAYSLVHRAEAQLEKKGEGLKSPRSALNHHINYMNKEGHRFTRFITIDEHIPREQIGEITAAIQDMAAQRIKGMKVIELEPQFAKQKYNEPNPSPLLTELV